MKIFIFFLFGIIVNAQMAFQGKVRDEVGRAVSNAEILIPEQKIRTATDPEGNFSVNASPGAVLRVLKNGYHRTDVRLRAGQSWYDVVLADAPIAIEEVEIRRKMTQDLGEDLTALQGSAKTRAMREEVRQYIRRPSAESVLQARHGEFVQPVGPGFAATLWIDDKWNQVNYLDYLISYFGQDFFEKELGLYPTEIQPFVYFVLAKIDYKAVLKYGRALPEDLAQFEKVARQNLYYFKNGRRHPAKK